MDERGADLGNSGSENEKWKRRKCRLERRREEDQFDERTIAVVAESNSEKKNKNKNKKKGSIGVIATCEGNSLSSPFIEGN